MQTIRQQAQGNAVLTVKPNSPHCSVTEPTINVEWQVSILADVKALDAQRFLLDARSFSEYFAHLSEDTQIDFSCESLCHQCAKDFLSMFGTRKNLVKEICVKISPFPGVFAEYTATNEPKEEKEEKETGLYYVQYWNGTYWRDVDSYTNKSDALELLKGLWESQPYERRKDYRIVQEIKP